MEPKKLLSQKFKNLKSKHLFRAFLTCLIIGLIISVAVLASVKNEKIIYKDKPVSVSQTSAREIKSLTQVIAKAQEDKALLEAQQKPENNAKIKALTTLIAQLQTTKKTIEDNAQDIERFRLKIKRLEEEKRALNTQLEEVKQDKNNPAKIRELEAQIKDKNDAIERYSKDLARVSKQKNAEIAFLLKSKNALEEEKANAPAIFQELKELKELYEKKDKELGELLSMTQEHLSKFTNEERQKGVENTPEISEKQKLFTEASDKYGVLREKIIQAIKKNKY